MSLLLAVTFALVSTLLSLALRSVCNNTSTCAKPNVFFEIFGISDYRTASQPNQPGPVAGVEKAIFRMFDVSNVDPRVPDIMERSLFVLQDVIAVLEKESRFVGTDPDTLNVRSSPFSGFLVSSFFENIVDSK